MIAMLSWAFVTIINYMPSWFRVMMIMGNKRCGHKVTGRGISLEDEYRQLSTRLLALPWHRPEQLTVTKMWLTLWRNFSAGPLVKQCIKLAVMASTIISNANTIIIIINYNSLQSLAIAIHQSNHTMNHSHVHRVKLSIHYRILTKVFRVPVNYTKLRMRNNWAMRTWSYMA